MLPVVPPHPPRLLPGRTADQEFWLWLGKAVSSAVALVVVGEVVERLDRVPGGTAVVLPLGLLWFWAVFFRWFRAVGRRKLAELAEGYTTLTFVFGSLVRYPYRRHRYGDESRVPWDYRGLWVLGSDGRVKSAPDATVEPPGFYPSPNRPGAWELWTGATWAGQFRE